MRFFHRTFAFLTVSLVAALLVSSAAAFAPTTPPVAAEAACTC